MPFINLFQPKLLAVLAIILAFPPVFTNFGKNEGLRLSLSLFFFYLCRGMVTMVVSVKCNRSDGFLDRMNSVFHFAEFPMALGAIYFGLKHVPDWIVIPYEGLLLALGPIIIILEGIASMIIIMSSGQGLMSFLEDRSDMLRAFFGLVCLILYSVSIMVIFSLYYSGQIHTLTVASLVSVALTLVGVLSIGTIMLEHGVITDSALLFLYITYNIWILTKEPESSAFVNAPDPKNLLYYFQRLSWFSPSQETLLPLVGTLFHMFSMELLTSLFIQMSVFLMATKILDDSEESDEVKELNYSSIKDTLLSTIWPCFGKSILVLIYTFSWLNHGLNAQVSWYIQPDLWRWINIFFCITIYMKHLLTPVDDDYAPIWKYNKED